MKKIILIVGTISILMLLTTSFVSVVGSNPATRESKESPLFKVRAQKALSIKLGNILEQIKTRFLGERIYMVPFSLMSLLSRGINDRFQMHSVEWSSCKGQC